MNLLGTLAIFCNTPNDSFANHFVADNLGVCLSMFLLSVISDFSRIMSWPTKGQKYAFLNF